VTRTESELTRRLHSGDVAAVTAFFEGAGESERAPFSKLATNWRAELERQRDERYQKYLRGELGPNVTFDDYQRLQPAASAGILACDNIAQLKALGTVWGLDGVFARILAARSLSLQEYCESLCGSRFGWSAPTWRQVRSLVRAGLCRPPEHENYVLGALEGIRPIPRWRENQQRAADGMAPLPEPALEDVLVAELDWLETAFWRLFEIEGNGRVSLANCDKYRKGSQQGWTAAIRELSRRGILARDRLLDMSLAALARDFPQFRAGWFSRFHEALEPTPDERVVRLDTYLGLLASNLPPTAAFALDAVAIVDAARPMAAHRLIPALSPALLARTKIVVKTALKLLARIAARDASARTEVCIAATMALLHEAADVQKAVFDLLDRHGNKADAVLRAKLAENSAAVTPSVRPRLQPWSAGVKSAATTTPHPEPIRVELVPRSGSPVDPSRAIDPITTLDDLLHAAAAVLETANDPDEIERVLDGMSRLCDQRPVDFERRAAPLLKRVYSSGRSIARARSAAVESGFETLLVSWLGGVNACDRWPEQPAEHRSGLTFLQARFTALSRQFADGRARPMLAAPTHRGGWIEPAALVARWRAWQAAGDTPDRYEQVLALLRLAPAERAAQLPHAAKITGEAGRALRHALGLDGPPGADAALWLAAYRSRSPRGDLPDFERVHPGLGPDAGSAAQYVCGPRKDQQHAPDFHPDPRNFPLDLHVTPPVSAVVDDALLPVLLHQRMHYLHSTSRPLQRWLHQLWPANHEPLFASAITTLHLAIRWSDVRDRETIGCVEPLTDPTTRLGPAACHILALALAAKDVALRGHAQEGLIAAIADSRLEIDELGSAMLGAAGLVDTSFVRWAKSLQEVARVSRAHAAAVATLLQRITRVGGQRNSKEIGASLELLVELLTQIGGSVTDPGARAYLNTVQGSNRRAKLARHLLKLSAASQI